MSKTDLIDKSKKNSTSSFKLISKDSTSHTLEVTNEGMEYLNHLSTNLIGIISTIGPEKSEKSYFSNLILGDNNTFDTSKSTSGIDMWGQPNAQGQSTDLLVFDTEGLFKPSNGKTNYDKQTFILSCLTSSIMVYNTNETIQDCVNKFTNLAKESLSCMKMVEGKDLPSSELPLVYFILHNNNIDSNTANQQFRNLVKDNPIFSVFFQNYKICVLKKAGDLPLARTKSFISSKLKDIGSLDDQDYNKKAKLIKEQIMNDLEPKKINNCNIDGKCLYGLIQFFVDSLNNGENIILYDQFNNVLGLCLSEVVDLINYNFTSDILIKKQISHTSNEQTYLDIIKTTFNDCITEQYDKLKSTPIVKISRPTDVIKSIKDIFRKCLDILCENIQLSINKKTNIINEVNKAVFTYKIKDSNIEQLLNEYNCFINEKILSPLYEHNDLKLQNNDALLKVLKDKICGTLEKFSPMIQAGINKLIEENKKLYNELNNFKKNRLNEIKEKDAEILAIKLKLEKISLDIRDKELDMNNQVDTERIKFAQLEETYNKEIQEKNNKIEELRKQINILSYDNTKNNGMMGNKNNIQVESLKKDYNEITDFLVKYKILLDQTLNDKNFFFENILMDKSIGILKDKYPDIFDLLSSKEDLENLNHVYEADKEILKKNINSKESTIKEKDEEIAELNEKLRNITDEYNHLNFVYNTKVGICTSLEANNESLKIFQKEDELKLKSMEKEIKETKDKYEQTLKEKNQLIKEIKTLTDIILSILCKNQSTFQENLNKLSENNKQNIKNFLNLYKPKW